MAVPGRPILYRTTQNFLRSFGLSSLEELPDLPNASAEDEQITLDMQENITRLQEAEEQRRLREEQGEEEEPITDEELEAAARELAQREETLGGETPDEPVEPVE